jgi:uncharacterized integral membrane protein
MKYAQLIVFVFIFGVSFASENTQPVILRYYFNLETPSFPMYLLMFIPLLIGIFAGSLVGFGDDEKSSLIRNTVMKVR